MSKVRPTAQDAIIEAAFQVLAKSPGASLGDIAAHAGVGRATLHRHFAGREELMLALARVANADLEAAVIKAVDGLDSAGARLEASLAAMMPLANRHSFLSGDLVDRDAEIVAANAADRAWLCAEIERAKSEGVFARDVPTLWVAESYEAVLYAGWMMIAGEEATPKQAAKLAWRTLTHGLKGQPE